jgi:hypothetical protein
LVVEDVLDLMDPSDGVVRGQVKTAWKPPADLSVGVFAKAALPGGVGVAGPDSEFECGGEVACQRLLKNTDIAESAPLSTW